MNCKNRNDLILKNACLKKGDAALHWFGHAGAAAPHSFRGQSRVPPIKKLASQASLFYCEKSVDRVAASRFFEKNPPSFITWRIRRFYKVYSVRFIM